MGSKSSDGGASAMIAQANEVSARAAREFANVNLPDIEKQKLLLEQLVSEGNLTPEELGQTSLAGISLDPRYKQAQMNALKEMQDLGRTGLGAEDRFALSNIQDSIANQEQARQAGILRNMQEQGSLDSGEQLASQLMSSQAATQSANRQGQELAAQAAQARRQALEQSSNMAGNMSQAEYGQKSDVARAKDVAAQFNAQNRFGVQQYNLGNKQRLSEANVGTRNEQQQFNKGLLQQQFNNQMAKASGAAGAYSNQANTMMNAASMAKPTKGTNWGGIIGTAAGAGAGAMAAPGSPQAVSAGAGIGGQMGGMFGGNDGGIKYQDGGIFNPYEQAEFRQKEASPLTKWIDSQRNTNQGSGDLRKFDEKALQAPSPIPMPAQNELPKPEGQESPWAKYAGIASSLSSNLSPKQEEEPARRPMFQQTPLVSYYKDGGMENEVRPDEAIDAGLLKHNSDAQKELLAMARGDIMPEDSMSGRIIGGEDFSGDNLPDRINSGEMVLNIPQQDNIKKELDKKTAQNLGFLKIVELLGKRNG